MEINTLFDKIKIHPEFDKVGMILCHNGVVRSTSRKGGKVYGLRVSVDHEKLAEIIETSKQMPGIIEVLVEIAEDKDLKIGDNVMYLLVAGDFRENVIAALTRTLNAIKSSVTSKTEFFIE